MSLRSYILQIMLWLESILKSIHYRTLLIFQNKKNNRFEGQNIGGDKRHVILPMSKHRGDISPPSPPRIYALVTEVFKYEYKLFYYDKIQIS